MEEPMFIKSSLLGGACSVPLPRSRRQGAPAVVASTTAPLHVSEQNADATTVGSDHCNTHVGIWQTLKLLEDDDSQGYLGDCDADKGATERQRAQAQPAQWLQGFSPPSPPGLEEGDKKAPKACGATKRQACVCGTPLMKDARFCFQCGKKQEEVCPCGAAYLPNALFCCMCGLARGQQKALAPSTANAMDDSTASPSSDSGGSIGGSVSYPSEQSTWMDVNQSIEEITTLMVCDIPCRRSIEQVMEAFDIHGFAGTYDLVYMPHQKGRRTPSQSQNVGYAFVNFKTAEWASAFMNIFRNVRFPDSSSSKLSYAKPARCQGYEANLEMHSRKSAAGALVSLR